MEDNRCKDHPDAPHGFMRDASHSAGRYVCECESWEPKQEPVAWMHVQGNYEEPSFRQLFDDEVERGWGQYPLFTAPVTQEPVECMCGICKLGKREWVGLTDEEVSYCRYAATFCDELDTAYMAELIEQALKEKNT